MAQAIVTKINAISHILEYTPENILAIFLPQSRQDQRVQNVISLAAKHNININYIKENKIYAHLKPRKLQDEKFLVAKTGLFLVLDGVQDPHNLGACLRSAAAANVTAVIIPKDRSAPITDTVRDVSCGATETLDIVVVSNLARSLALMQKQGVWIVGTEIGASKTLYEVDLTGNIAIVMGGEHQGLRDLTKKHCDYLVSLPMAGKMQSLNVSVATGVCLFEAVRQLK